MSASVVLVHGAWHGGWCWETVIDGLAAEGVTATAVDLEMRDLDGDSEIVRRAVADARRVGDPVLVTGHSYGGMAISAGAQDADHLVYLAAFLLPSDVSVIDATVSTEATALMAAMVFNDDGTVTINPAVAGEAFYNRCPQAIADAAVRRLRPVNLACFTETVPDPAWSLVSSTYVMCSDDHTVAPALQREMMAHAQHGIVLDADHSPFYSATPRIVSILAERAGHM